MLAEVILSMIIIGKRLKVSLASKKVNISFWPPFFLLVPYISICFHSVQEHKSVRQNEFKARAGYQSFDPLLHARFFRLRINARRRHQCLNMELYGCE